MLYEIQSMLRIYLLWRNIIGLCPHVYLLKHVHAGDDEEDARTSGSTCQETTKAEDDRSLIFLQQNTQNYES